MWNNPALSDEKKNFVAFFGFVLIVSFQKVGIDEAALQRVCLVRRLRPAVSLPSFLLLSSERLDLGCVTS